MKSRFSVSRSRTVAGGFKRFSSFWFRHDRLAFARPLALIFLIALVGSSLPRFLPACIICEDVTTPGEQTLEKLIREKGAEAVPELRKVLTCDTNPQLRLKVIAARELGRLGDRESIPDLKKIVFEVIDPRSSSDFGVATAEHALRSEAAKSLARMKVEGVGERLWGSWRRLPPPRQEEIPGLLFCLNVPDLQEKQLEMLRDSHNQAVEFQVMVELRRSAGARAIPAVEAKISEWEKILKENKTPGRGNPFLPRMIRYARGTIRALKRR